MGVFDKVGAKGCTLEGCRAYATVENLMKGLKKYGFDQDRFVLAYTAEGKVTAIFPVTNLTGPEGGGYLGLYAQKGFMTLG